MTCLDRCGVNRNWDSDFPPRPNCCLVVKGTICKLEDDMTGLL